MRLTVLCALLLVMIGCTDTGSSTGATPTAAAPAPAAADPAPAPREGMVNTANPHATAAGAEMLARGGSAVDAAIAAHAVLGLVEPQSFPGLGGGGFMVVHDAESGTREVIDGRETAPAGAFPEMFMAEDGTALSHAVRVQSGHAVGVPGAVALYWTAHQRHGRLPWADLFAPAIELAEDGFPVSLRMHESLVRIAQYTDIEDNPDTGAYFFPGGEVLAVDQLLKNPEYANTLRMIAEQGPSAFYEGPIAAAIAERVQQPPRPGTLTTADMAAEARVRTPVCAPFRDLQVCSAPPPSSGVAVLEALGLLERMAPEGLADTPEGWGLLIKAMLLAYADRDHYVGDGDFVDVPIADLLADAYLDERATQLFDPGIAPGPGDPGAVLRGMPIIDRWGRDPTEEVPGTSHLSVIDAMGNAVSFTASVEFVFGSQRMAAGFILNNELTDFAAVPTKGGRAVANAVAAGKRPRSSMTPTLVYDAQGELLMATGSPGGNSIIAYTLKSIVGVLEFDLSVADAVALPNVVARGLPVRVESERAPEGFVDALRDLGFQIAESAGENSGLHPILVRADGLEGAPDPRREGVATRVPQAATPAAP